MEKEIKKRFKNHHKFFLIGLIGGWILLLLLAVSGSFLVAYWNKILPGVSIASVEVGNKTGEEAAKIIEGRVRQIEGEAIKVVAGENEWKINDQDLGVVYDIPASINAAWVVGREGNLLLRLSEAQQSFVKGKNLDLMLVADEKKIDDFVASISAVINEEMVEPALIVNEDETVSFKEGADGVMVDEVWLKNELMNRLARLDTSNLGLKTKTLTTEVNRDKLDVIKTDAEKLVGRKMKLKTEDEEWEVTGEEMVGMMSLVKEGFDEKKVGKVVADLAEGMNREPVNARFAFENGKVSEFQAGRNGIKVNQKELVNLIVNKFDELVGKDEEEIVAEVPAEIIEPEIKTGEVNNLGIKELVGKGESTYFHSIPNRVHNVALAAKRVSGTLVKPGETFSFNNALGDVSRATGFLSAYVISNGRTVLGDGGGVCQVSTTLFRALLNAGLPIVERHAHSYRVGYYEQDSPPGIDATVYNPTADLKFKNDTPAYLLIQATVDEANRYLEFDIYGTDDGRAAEITTPKVWGQSPPPPALYQEDPTLAPGTKEQVDWAAWGAKASFNYKSVTKNGEVIQEKTFYSNYRPWQAVYLVGPSQ